MGKTPPLQSCGRKLWTYEEVENFELSLIQLYDQTIRHLKSHNDKHKNESNKFYHRLIQDVKKMECALVPSDVKNSEKNPGTEHNPDEDLSNLENKKELIIETQINEVTKILKKHEKHDKQENDKLQTINQEICNYLRNLELNIEYQNIQKYLSKELEQDSEEKSDPSLEEINFTPCTQAQRRHTRRTHLKETQQSIQSNIPDNKSNELEDQREKIKTLEAINNQLQLELQQSQEAFSDLNKEIASMRNQSEKQHQENQTSNENSNFDYDALIGKDVDSTEIDAEVVENTEQEALQPKEVPKLIKSLKEKDSNTQQYRLGFKLLKNDFLNYGRKTWNTKTVEKFLKILYNNYLQNENIQIPTSKEVNEELGIDIMANLTNLQQQITQLNNEMDQLQTDLKNEFETLKANKTKYATLQIIVGERNLSIKYQMKQIHMTADTLLNKIKDKTLLSTNKIITLIKDTIETGLKKLPENYKITEEINKQELFIQNKRKKLSGQEKHKIILKPKMNKSSELINQFLREEAKKLDEFPLLNTVRKTSNKNIEIKANVEELTKIKQMIEESPDLKEITDIIEPDKKVMKILLLKVPDDITEEDLLKNLQYHKYFYEDDFQIIKPIQSQNSGFNNWIIQSCAKSCRNILKRQKIRVFTELIRVVNYIRIKRCTNCQGLSHHTAHECRWQPECANCAGEHHVNDCATSVKKCANCVRYKYPDVNHAATDINCPRYQEVKQQTLEQYYQQGNTRTSVREAQNRHETQNREYREESSSRKTHGNAQPNFQKDKPRTYVVTNSRFSRSKEAGPPHYS